jgi:N-dimethylarginine dimethylaminohydrolase
MNSSGDGNGVMFGDGDQVLFNGDSNQTMVNFVEEIIKYLYVISIWCRFNKRAEHVHYIRASRGLTVVKLDPMDSSPLYIFHKIRSICVLVYTNLF